jgi:hypothetical protein
MASKRIVLHEQSPTESVCFLRQTPTTMPADIAVLTDDFARLYKPHEEIS